MELRNPKLNRIQEPKGQRIVRAKNQEAERLLQDRKKQVEKEHEELLRKVEDARKRMSSLDIEIGRLRNQLPAEDDELALPLHPIRRWPDDVLLVLFEHCSQPRRDPSASFKAVTNLSHVCKTWRSVALKAPSLWTDIYVSMWDNGEAFQAFLDHMRDRVRSRDKDRLINLTIDHIQGFYKYPLPRDPTTTSTTLKAFIESLQLDQFGVIDTLDLCLTKSKDITAITPSTFNLSRTSIKHVVIRSHDQESQPYWDCSWLLKQLGSLTVLQLDNIGHVELEGDYSFPSLEELYLEGIHMPWIAVELRRFPNLKQLFIQGEEFNMVPLSELVEFPELWELKVLDVKQFPWTMVTAGKLRKLSTNDRTQEALEFMRLHHSITHFIAEATLNEEEFEALAKNLSNIEILDADGEIGGLWGPAGHANTLPPFPKLRHLIIKLWDTTENRSKDDIEVGIEVSEEMVENWLRARHFRSELKEDGLDIQVMDTWEIDGSYEALDQALWRESPLLENCTQSLTALDQFGDEMKTWVLKLQWSN